MKLKVDKVVGNEKFSVCIYDKTDGRWIDLAEAVQASKFKASEALAIASKSTSVMEFLAGGHPLVEETERLLEHVRQTQPKLREVGEVAVKPFEPKSFRDFCCYKAHLAKATIGLLKLYPETFFQVLSIMFARMLRLPIPKLKHLHHYFDKPVHYSGNHLAFYTQEEVVAWPCYTDLLDYELEVAIIIGKPVKNATEEEALAAIGGFVLINDISNRDCQMFESSEVQFGFAKTKNAASSISNVVVTADEFLPLLLDPSKGCKARVKINDKVVAESTTGHPSQMHGVAEMVRFASLGEQLYPGEVLGMGTLPGCCSLENGNWVKPGDLLTLEVDNLGTLTNTIGEKEEWPADTEPAVYKHLSYKKRGGKSSSIGGQAKFALFIVLLAVYLALKRSPLEPTKWQNPGKLPTFEGVSAKNCDLCGAERLHEGEMIAPESMDNAPDGTMYLSLGDGRVVKTDSEGMNPVTVFFSGGFRASSSSKNGLEDYELMAWCTQEAKAGKLYLSEENERKCGRPLGLRYVSGALYFVDAHHGLFKLDLKTGFATHLFNSGSDSITSTARAVASEATLPSIFLNDLVVKDKVIYMTETSYKNSRVMNRAEVLDGAPRGRLLKYNITQKTTEVLMCGLHFPNGLQLTYDSKALLLIESTRFRILKIPLSLLKNGALKDSLSFCGESEELPAGVEVWAEMVPGFADNIRTLHDGKTYAVGFGVRSVTPFSVVYTLSQKPNLLKFLGKIVPLRHVSKLAPKHSLVAYFNSIGEITRVLHDPSGKTVPLISEAHLNTVSGNLFLGSSFNSFLGRLPV